MLTYATFCEGLLRKAGIPINGITFQQMFYSEEPTEEQKKLANTMMEDFVINQEKYNQMWQDEMAKIERFGGEKNVQLIDFLLSKGIATQDELDKYFN